MTAKRLMILVLAMALLIAIPALLYANSAEEAEAELAPINDSGIEAEIEFEDDGTTLTVPGEAEGMTPGVVYRSLLYDIASSPLTCVPALPPGDPNDIRPTMLLGFWDVNEGGEGTLSATNTNDGAAYVPLSKIGTVSIRLAPGVPSNLQACGAVGGDDDGDNDDDGDGDDDDDDDGDDDD